jgi:drug/metabolite transporter (DMT)-like permease
MRARVVMLDAAFEAVLGTVLVLGVVFGSIDDRDFPDPGTDLVLGVFGLTLIGVAVGLASLVSRELVTDTVLRGLAAGNAAFAVLIALWALMADGWTDAGRAVAWTTTAMLLLLALMQFREARAGR